VEGSPVTEDETQASVDNVTLRDGACIQKWKTHQIGLGNSVVLVKGHLWHEAAIHAWKSEGKVAFRSRAVGCWHVGSCDPGGQLAAPLAV
jgi:hypothetical protein